MPNKNIEKVFLKEILSSTDFISTNGISLALGKDIAGKPIITDLGKMPHLLIAGTTGSGKSVSINAMIISLLYKFSPKECKLIMIDPKMLELSVYEGIPHLLHPVVTDPRKASKALPASALLKPDPEAIASISSFLFILSSLKLFNL